MCCSSSTLWECICRNLGCVLKPHSLSGRASSLTPYQCGGTTTATWRFMDRHLNQQLRGILGVLHSTPNLLPRIYQGFLEQAVYVCMYICMYVFYLLVLEREEREKERGRNIDLFHLLMHSLVDFCMCPDQGSNQKP